MIEFTALNDLQTALLAARATSTMPTIPISFHGKTFVIPNDQKYIEEVFLPNADASYEPWGSGSQGVHVGAYRLILHWPKDQSGVAPAGALMQSIASYFTKEKRFGVVKITREPHSMGIIEAGTDQIFPVSMRYSAA